MKNKQKKNTHTHAGNFSPVSTLKKFMSLDFVFPFLNIYS